MAKSNKQSKKQTTPTQPVSPVQPLESTGTPPSDNLSDVLRTIPPVDNAAAQEEQQAELKKAFERAEAAEARAHAAEEAAASAQDRAIAAEQNLATVQEEQQPYISPSQQALDRFDSDGKEVCWNCANNGRQVVLSGGNTCSDCGFVKDKLYNGTIEAEKAGQRQLAEGY